MAMMPKFQWRSQDFKVGGHTGEVRRADAGVGFLGRGSAGGSSPSARMSGESCHYPHPSKNLLGFARILWPCLSTVGGGGCPLSPRGYATAKFTPVYFPEIYLTNLQC